MNEQNYIGHKHHIHSRQQKHNLYSKEINTIMARCPGGLHSIKSSKLSTEIQERSWNLELSAK